MFSCLPDAYSYSGTIDTTGIVSWQTVGTQEAGKKHTNAVRVSAHVMYSNTPFAKQIAWPTPTQTGQGRVCPLPTSVENATKSHTRRCRCKILLENEGLGTKI